VTYTPVMSSYRRCAYCGSVGQLTREHVFSRFFYSRDANAEYEKVISPVTRHGKEKFVQSELTIAEFFTNVSFRQLLFKSSNA